MEEWTRGVGDENSPMAELDDLPDHLAGIWSMDDGQLGNATWISSKIRHTKQQLFLSRFPNYFGVFGQFHKEQLFLSRFPNYSQTW